MDEGKEEMIWAMIGEFKRNWSILSYNDRRFNERGSPEIEITLRLINTEPANYRPYTRFISERYGSHPEGLIKEATDELCKKMREEMFNPPPLFKTPIRGKSIAQTFLESEHTRWDINPPAIPDASNPGKNFPRLKKQPKPKK